MKKTFLILMITFFAFTASAQQGITWFTMGVFGGGGTSMFLNKNVFDNADFEANPFTLTSTYGGRFGLHFTAGRNYVNNLALLFEGAKSQLGTTWDIQDIVGNEIHTRTLMLTTSDFSVNFRYISEAGGFVEIGHRFTTVKEVQDENEADIALYTADLESFENKINMLEFGFGFTLVQTPYIDLSLGFKGAYAYKDIWADDNLYQIYDENLPTFDPSPVDTKALRLMARLEFNYYFGYFGVASCGKPGLKLFQQ